jgi:hypothetical protein
VSGILTRNQRLNAAGLFKDQFDTRNLYVFIARPIDWPDENVPPTGADTIKQTQHDIWRNMVAIKKILPANVSFSIPRTDWEANTVYTKYDDRVDVFSEPNFFAITDDFNVYKCLDNNGGANSTIKPTGRSNTSFYAADGYQWKYMYTVSAADSQKFLTTNFVPVKHLDSDDGSNQWDVQSTAANSSIETYTVSAVGSGYRGHTGTAASGNSSGIVLASGASSANGYYTGSAVYISSGTGIGQLRTITGYRGSNKFAKVASWSINPDGTSHYIVSPKVTVTGDGAGATARSTLSGNTIADVYAVTIGQSYSYATVAFSGNTGSGAVANTYISPLNGHGANSVAELCGYNVTMTAKFTGSESNTILVSPSFRVAGIMERPRFLANNSYVTGTVYDMTTMLNLTSITGTFVEGETVTGGSSGSTGFIAQKDSASQLRITNIYKKFTTSEVITGGTSGATGTISTITLPLVKRHSARTLFFENRDSVDRDADQQEDFRLTLSF